MLSEKQKRALKVVVTSLIFKILRKKRVGRRPDTDGLLRGSGYLNEILDGNPSHCQEMLRMKKEAFISLCGHFRNRGWLEDSRYVSIEEKMTMFLITLSHNIRNRFVKRRFNHSTQTIHKYFHEVLHAMLHFSKEMIVPTTTNSVNHISHHRRLRGIFEVFFSFYFNFIGYIMIYSFLKF